MNSFIIFSAPNYCDVTDISELVGVPVSKIVPVDGCYKGVLQQSYLLYMDDMSPQVRHDVSALIFTNLQQESYLFVSHEREGFLHTAEYDVQWLGHFQQSRYKPESGSWSRFGKYYFVVSTETIHGSMQVTL